MLFHRLHLVNYSAQTLVITQARQRGGAMGVAVHWDASSGLEEGDCGTLWQTSSRNPPPPTCPPVWLCFQLCQQFPPASGWRQGGQPGAFKSLLGFRGREAGPPIRDRRHPTSPPQAIKASQDVSRHDCRPLSAPPPPNELLSARYQDGRSWLSLTAKLQEAKLEIGENHN